MVVFLNIKYHTFEKKKKKQRDKDHHAFSYGPILLLNSQPHIYFTVITFTYSHQRKEKRDREENMKRRWRLWCTDRRPAEIEFAERTKLVEISVHHAALPCPPPHRCLSSSLPPDWVRLACCCSSSSSSFYSSYLLVLIQLYCKNWILFCVLCLDYVRRFLRVKKRD